MSQTMKLFLTDKHLNNSFERKNNSFVTKTSSMTPICILTLGAVLFRNLNKNHKFPIKLKIIKESLIKNNK